jgi:hypothetical protein
MRVRSTPVMCCSAPEIEVGSILGWFCPLPFFPSGCGDGGAMLSAKLARCFCMLIALADSLLVGVVHLQLLLQHKQQFRTPSALQTLGNLRWTGLNSRNAEFIQLSRIGSRFVYCARFRCLRIHRCAPRRRFPPPPPVRGACSDHPDFAVGSAVPGRPAAILPIFVRITSLV